jgi:hypothetical protein
MVLPDVVDDDRKLPSVSVVMAFHVDAENLLIEQKFCCSQNRDPTLAVVGCRERREAKFKISSVQQKISNLLRHSCGLQQSFITLLPLLL